MVSIAKRRRKALDVETTGVDLHHTHRPFFVSISEIKPEGILSLSWRWRVDPFTRFVADPTQQDFDEILEQLNDPDIDWVLHNGLFDVLALDKFFKDYGIFWDAEAFLSRIDDTMLKSHTFDSLESHGLKDLAVKYCNWNQRDQKDLKDCVNLARGWAGRLGWAIASPATVPTQRRQPKDGWWVMDMWLPYEIWEFAQTDPAWKQVVPDYFRTAVDDYCNGDTGRTLAVDSVMTEALATNGLVDPYRENLATLLPIYRMQNRGVTIKPELVRSERPRLRSLSEKFRAAAGESCGRPGFNPASPKQMCEVLYDQFGFEVTKRTKKSQSAPDGNPSSDKSVLEELVKVLDPDTPEYQFCLNVLCSKKCGTSATFLDAYEHLMVINVDTGIATLHPSYNPTGTHTTRLSSSNPNGQNVGKGDDPFMDDLYAQFDLSLRKVFGPGPGREWYAVDYQQLQLVILAYVSGEQSMIDAVKRGYDFHDFMGWKIFDLAAGTKLTKAQRRVAKNCNFGYLFGASPHKIEETCRRPGLYGVLEEMFPAATGFIGKNKRAAQMDGYVWAAGYRLTVPEDKPYAATNYIIQGWEGRIVKKAMIDVDRFLREETGDQAFLSLNVHDELVFDFPEGMGESYIWYLCDLMEKAGDFYQVPCRVEATYINDNWQKGEKVEFYQAA